jgi:hypothetical protein
MDMQSIVNMINENAKKESGKEYNLGMLINDLEKYNNEFLEVEFDDGSIPSDFDSWRGSYCELALGYEEKGICHNHTLYRKAYNANGSMYEGYKGGEFIMDLDTPMHQANYGEDSVYLENGDCECKKIIGVEKKR